jgi:hypothetical protein
VGCVRVAEVTPQLEGLDLASRIAMLAKPPDWLRARPRFARIAMLASPPDWLRVAMVRTAGFEPACPYGPKILSLLRLPVPPRPRSGCSANYSAVTSLKLSRSRISLPGLK